MKTLSMKVLIVDDEAPARQRLSGFLKAVSDVEIVGECENGEQALESIARLVPDLVFLDVQMPGLGGFEVVSALSPEHRPQIVFVTAFDEYAVRAFEAQALDYLLKPFRKERLLESLARVRHVLDHSQEGITTLRLESLLKTLPKSENYPQRLVVKDGARISVLLLSDVVSFIASGNYVEVCTTDKRCLLLRETMNHLEARMDPSRFFRASRSALINLGHVREILSEDKDCHMVIMDNGSRARLTAKLEALQSRLT